MSHDYIKIRNKSWLNDIPAQLSLGFELVFGYKKCYKSLVQNGRNRVSRSLGAGFIFLSPSLSLPGMEGLFSEFSEAEDHSSRSAEEL